MVRFKQKGVWHILAALLMTACLSTTVFARSAPGTIPPLPPKAMSQKELNANAWYIWTTNYGPWCNPQANSGGFWRDRGYGYIFGAGMYVGAEDEYGNKIVSVGYNPNSMLSEMGPVSLADTSWESYLTDAGARVYLSTDASDVAAWPVKENGKNVIKSRQDSYAMYSDENPQFTTSGDKILGVAIEQFSYAWNYADNNDIVFFYFKVHNISGKNMSNVYIGSFNDCDIGDESNYEPNDRTTFDYTRNLSMQFQTEPEPGWDKTGVVGFRYFESPFNNTGDTIHVIDNQYPRDILPDSALGMTAFKIFVIEQDPTTDEQRYYEMQGINYWNMVMDAYDEWGADQPGDKRFVMASGPLNLDAGAFVTCCLGAIGALDTIALKSASDVAQSIYDNNFQLATPPASPTLTVTAGDKYVTLSWDRKAETEPDPYWEGLPDTMGWYPYFPGSWTWLAPSSQLLVDSFNIKIIINDSTSSSENIARGAANPVAGADTLFAHYCQRELYVKYDLQGYLIYRARTMINLTDPTKREYVGTAYTNTDTLFNSTTVSYPGGSGYMYDKKDGIQVVNDLENITIMSPMGIFTLPKFNTLGSDRGLIYTLIDSNVVNGFGWYYGVSAYDYQNNVYFTHKCPTSLASSPTENAVFCAARTPAVDIKPASVTYVTSGASDLRHKGTVDYSHQLITVPSGINNDTFYLKWQPMAKVVKGTDLYPQYSAELHDMQVDSSGAVVDTILGTLKLVPQGVNYDVKGDSVMLLGPSFDELPFGGVVFRPYYSFKPWEAGVESLDITGSYPLDSIWTQIYGSTNFTILTGLWQWRGSDFEIRWKDSTGLVGTNPDGSILTATVWDITNNVEVPKEAAIGLWNKNNMTQSSWCFGPLAPYCRSYIDSLTSGTNSSANQGMYICGITIYFNKRNNGTLRRMIWPLRPHTGDVWTVRSTGKGVPSEGEVVTFITSKASQISNLSEDLLKAVKVVPNPYLVRHNWDVSKNYPNIHFTHLPAKCTIRIFNLAGDLVRVLNHESAYADNNGIEKWDLLSSYDKRAASGVYIYQVDAPGIGTKLGKFAIIK